MHDTYSVQIVRDPLVNGGEPSLRGTRVTVRTVLASLACRSVRSALILSISTFNSSIDF